MCCLRRDSRDKELVYELISNDVFCPGAVGKIPVYQFLHALLQTDAGLPAEHLAGFADIGHVAIDVGGMGGDVDAPGFFAEQLLEGSDHRVDGHDFVPAQVEDLVADMLERQERAGGDVVHIGEAARLLTVTGDGDGSAFRDPLAEAKHRHIGTPGRTVDGEVAHDGGIDAVEVVIGIGEGFGALFAGGVGSEGVVGGGALEVRLAANFPIETGSGGKNEFGHALPAGIFEHVEGAEGVGVEVAPGVAGALAHARHGSEVDDSLGVGGELGELVDSGQIGNVGF